MLEKRNMRRGLVIGAVLFASAAFAQQQSPQRSPMEQALSERLGVEISTSLQATAAVIELQRQLAAAQARIKELESEKPTEK